MNRVARFVRAAPRELRAGPEQSVTVTITSSAPVTVSVPTKPPRWKRVVRDGVLFGGVVEVAGSVAPALFSKTSVSAATVGITTAVVVIVVAVASLVFNLVLGP